MSVLCVGAVFSSAFGVQGVTYDCSNCGSYIAGPNNTVVFSAGSSVPVPPDLNGICSVSIGLSAVGWNCTGNNFSYSNSVYHGGGNSFTMPNTGDVTCVAQCQPETNCTLTYNCGTNGTGSATDPGGGSYTCNPQVQAQVLSGQGSCSNTYGYSFNNWSCEYGYAGSGMPAYYPSGNLTMSANVECTATWDDEIPITPCGNGNPPRTVILNQDPEGGDDVNVIDVSDGGSVWTDAVTGGYGTGIGTTIVPFSWGTIEVEGLCASNSGTYGVQGTPIESGGNNDIYCWCRLVSIVDTNDQPFMGIDGEPVTINNYPWVYMSQSSQTPCDPQYCASNCTDFLDRVTTDPDVNRFLHALYTKNICEYSVTYNCGGAVSGQAPVDSNLYEDNDTVTVESNENACDASCGCRFNGWDCNGATYWGDGDTFNIPNDDVTCTALWTGCEVNYRPGNCPFEGFEYTDSGVDISAPYTPLTLSYINSQNPYTSSVNSGCYTFLGYNNSDPSGSNHPGQPDYPSNNGNFTPVSSIGGICDLYAACDLITYNVIYRPGNCSGVSGTYTDTVYGYETNYALVPGSTAFSGISNFKGWSSNSPSNDICSQQYSNYLISSPQNIEELGHSCTDSSDSTVLDLYAVCCVDEYTITYLPGSHGQYSTGYNSSVFGPGASNGGGTSGQPWSTQSLSNAHIEATDACYQFCGWSQNSSDTCGSNTIYSAGSSQGTWNFNNNLTLYAIWGCASGCQLSGNTCVPQTYDVTYDCASGSDDPNLVNPASYSPGVLVPYPRDHNGFCIPPSGATGSGWWCFANSIPNSDPNGNNWGNWYADDSDYFIMPSSSVTCTASYAYSVSYTCGSFSGSVSPATNSGYYRPGNPNISLTGANNVDTSGCVGTSGYSFNGWNCHGSGLSNRVNNGYIISSMPAYSVICDAQWTSIHTLVYDCSGCGVSSQDTPASVSIWENMSPVPLPNSCFSGGSADYDFVGWNCFPTATGATPVLLPGGEDYYVDNSNNVDTTCYGLCVNNAPCGPYGNVSYQILGKDMEEGYSPSDDGICWYGDVSVCMPIDTLWETSADEPAYSGSNHVPFTVNFGSGSYYIDLNSSCTNNPGAPAVADNPGNAPGPYCWCQVNNAYYPDDPTEQEPLSGYPYVFALGFANYNDCNDECLQRCISWLQESHNPSGSISGGMTLQEWFLHSLYTKAMCNVNLNWVLGHQDASWPQNNTLSNQTTCTWGEGAITPLYRPTRPGYTFNGWLVTNHTN